MGMVNLEREWLVLLVASSLLCIFFLTTSFNLEWEHHPLCRYEGFYLWDWIVHYQDSSFHIVSGSKGDLYHPLDFLFAEVGNVHVITKSNMVTYRGSTMVANTLCASVILLRRSKDWDWFINLSASDYPLVTQDDLMSAFSNLRSDMNFIEQMPESRQTFYAFDSRPWTISVEELRHIPGLAEKGIANCI